jgi:hypothetical protein
MSGAVPAKIAAAFTMAELAVLAVVGRQCRRGGTCSLHIDAIAALAGVSRTTVKRAMRQARLLGLVRMRQARLLGLVLVKERRIPGRKSLTNVVSVVSREWLAWLKLGVGGQKRPSTVNNCIRREKRKFWAAPGWTGEGDGQCVFVRTNR